MNTTIQIRIDQRTKTRAQKVFKDLGIDMSSGMKMFLNQVVEDKGLPFIPSTIRTRAIRRKWDREVATALKNGRRYSSAKAMHKDVFAD